MQNITKNNIILLSFILILFTTSCSVYKDIEVGDIQKIKVDKVSLKGVQLRVFLPLKNPNTYKIKIKKYDIDVKINGHKIGNVSSNEKIVINRKSEKVYEFPLDIKFKGMLMPTIMAIVKIFTRREVKISAKGTLKAKALFISKTIKINQNRTVNIFK